MTLSSVPVYLPEVFSPAPFPTVTQGQFSVKIADTQQEVIQAQQLRYHVFGEVMGATLPDVAVQLQRDVDAFDAVCDHLLVRYHETPEAEPVIIGTYRLLRQEKLPAGQAFYSESEYDISRLKSSGKRMMELGRSCTHPDVRNKAAMQLLWRGIGEYIMHHGIEVMFGCASFAGADAKEHAVALSYLHHYHRTPESLCPKTLEAYYTSMNHMPAEDIDQKKAFFKLPVLIKGYLRIGGTIGDGSFADSAFNTTDILVVVETQNVARKYMSRYAPDA